MELSHHTSDLDPSSVLGFGSALALLKSTEEVARLLTGALRSMGLADLQAVVIEGGDDEPRVFGSVGARPLPDPVVDALRRQDGDRALGASPESGSPSHRQVEVPADGSLAAEGIDRLALVRLGTVERDFGVAVAGLASGTTHTPLQVSSLQMMAAQTSMALHRIELDRKRAAQEQVLRESEARYRELYESAPVAYVSATAEGEIRMANRRATELFDASEATLVGRSIPDFCADTPKDRQAAQRLEQRLRDGEPVRDDEVELCLIDGTRIWVSLTMRPVDEVGDDQAERLVMMVDVTERRRMETALRDARDELETRVEERTAELERANERLEQKTQRLEALRDLDQAVLAAKSPKEIATATLRRARQIVPFYRASVSIIEEAEDQARVLATRQEDEFMEEGTTIPLEEYYLTDSLRAGETEIISDLAARPHSDAAAKVKELGIRSVLCLPMMVEGDLIGLLKIGRTGADAFADEDRRVGKELTDHLAIALRQARLLERVEERTAELERANERLSHRTQRLRTLRDIDQAIRAAESPEEIAAEAIRRVRDILPYKSATVTVIDRDADAAHVLAAQDNVLDAPTTLPLDEVYLSENLRAGNTEVISDEAYEPVPEAKARMHEMGLRSILCVPMVVEEEVIGVVHVGRTEADAFTDEDWRVGRELADHMAIALRQSRLLEEVQEQREAEERRARREAEAALRRAHDELEQKVAERTAELQETNEALKEEIAERKRAERALRKSRERLTRIIDSAIDAIISIDPNLEIHLFNAAAEEIFQCSAAAAECTSLDAFLTDLFEALVERHIEAHQKATAGEDGTAEADGRYLAAPEGLKAQRASGDTFPVEATLCPVQLPNEHRYLIILRDVNELKQAEEEVAQLESERSYLQEELKSEYNFDEIVGVSPPMQEVFDAIDQVADTETTVLITGETGTGKELVAHALHDRRIRAEHLSISDSSGPDGQRSFETLEEVRRRHIERALEQTGGVVGGDEGAAQLLDVKRTTLLSRMDRLGIEPSEYRV